MSPWSRSPMLAANSQDFVNLVHELVRLLGDEEPFTFGRHPQVSGTNNEAERTLRRTDRTSQTVRGAPPHRSGERVRIAAIALGLVHSGKRASGNRHLFGRRHQLLRVPAPKLRPGPAPNLHAGQPALHRPRAIPHAAQRP